jgi:wobble nucleotide-excising tRNase
MAAREAPDSVIDLRSYGRLEEKVEQLEALVTSQTNALNTLADRVESMNTLLSEAKGGWKTLMWAGGAAATFGALAASLFNHVRFQ